MNLKSEIIKNHPFVKNHLEEYSDLVSSTFENSKIFLYILKKYNEYPTLKNKLNFYTDYDISDIVGEDREEEFAIEYKLNENRFVFGMGVIYLVNDYDIKAEPVILNIWDISQKNYSVEEILDVIFNEKLSTEEKIEKIKKYEEEIYYKNE
ncbi:MAG: hypothetical protein ACPLZ9_03980 [Candidatus Ratteibacteria bacterium]